MYENCRITSMQMTMDRYLEVRNFLIRHYKTFDISPNWFIDRLEFTITVSAAMNGTDDKYFEEHNRLWYADDELIAIVNTEGELRGEAFFQISTYDLPASVLNEMFDFVETNLMIKKDGNMEVILRIAKENQKAADIAKKRGYKKGDWEEKASVLLIDYKRDVILPKGYCIVNRDEVSSTERSDSHRLAFGYDADEKLKLNCAIGFDAMRLQPDYRTELDLFVLNDNGSVGSFANAWFDSKNEIAILEPVGTIVSEQKKGLGRAVINELINRSIDLGAIKMYVGSDQVFYKRLGFEPICTDIPYILKK